MKFKNQFQSRLFRYFFIVVFIPIVCLGFSSYYFSSLYMEKHILKNQQQLIGLIENNLKLIFDDIQSISAYVLNNETVQNILNEADEANIETADRQINDYLSSFKNAKNYLSYILIYGENGLEFRYFSNYYREIIPYLLLKETALYNTTAALDGSALWNSSSSTLFPKLSEYDDIMISRRIKDIYDPEHKLGMLFIGINREVIYQLFNNISSSSNSQLILFDDNFNVIESNDINKDLVKFVNESLDIRRDILDVTSAKKMIINEQKFIVSTATVKPYDWTVSSLTPVDEIYQYSRISLFITVSVAITLLILITILSAYLSRRVTLPIKKLLKSMSNFKRGDFNQSVLVTSNDEIGILTQRYNEMVHDLNDLIQKMYVNQTHQKMIELRNLQAQIEPHFLYNTLDYIFLSSKINGDDQTARVVYSLSELFRISLNRGEDYYPFDYEIKQITAYITIQHARFPHRFNTNYDIDERILSYFTPKLILQPLVENCILHAFEDNEQPGLLSIRGTLDEKYITFEIIDNGKGMSSQTVNSFLIVKDSFHEKRGIGIRNVNERLIILFGSSYAIHIESTLNIGTKIRVRIPIIRTEEEWRERYESITS